MKFHDRKHAGEQLGLALQQYRTATTVVLTMPHGGILCAAPIAVELNAPLDLVFVKEIAYPSTPEFILGAVNENGAYVLRPEASIISQQWLAEEIARHKHALRRQRHVFLTNKSSVTLNEKTVILVDDGLSSHFKMQLAIESVRSHLPEKIVVAVPVAPPQIVQKLKEFADEVVVIEQPQYFFSAISNYYALYNVVSENEIKIALKLQ